MIAVLITSIADMDSCFCSLHVNLLHFISISILFNSQLSTVAWNPENGNAEFTGLVVGGTDANRSSSNGGSPTYLEFGFLDDGQERYVEKMSGEENVGGDMKVLILDKVRLLLGLHNVKGRSNVDADRFKLGMSPSPSPTPAPAPVPAPASRFHHVPIHHFSPLPHPGQSPSFQDGHVLRRNNGSRSRLRKVVIAVVMSVVATLLVGGITVLSLCYRSGRNKQKRPEEMMLVTGFGGSKILDSSLSSTLHQKMSPTPSQQLLCPNFLEPIQEEIVTVHKPAATSPNHKYSSPPPICTGEILKKADLPSLDEDDTDDHDESFHSVCNSDYSTARSSNASDAKYSNLPEVLSPSGLSNRSLSPDYDVKVPSNQLSPTKSPTSPELPESVEVNDLRSKPSPSHFLGGLNLQPDSSSGLHGSDYPVAAICSSNQGQVPFILEDKSSSPVETPKVNFPKPPPLPPSPALLKFQTYANNRKTSNLSSLPPLPLPPANPPQHEKKTNFSKQHPPVPPCLFQPSSALADKDGCPLPKLKPLHWDKVRASPDKSMAWDKIRTNSFELDEEMIESLFSYNLQGSLANEAKSKTPSPSKHILEPKRLQNFTILLKALNATTEQVRTSIMRGHGLSVQQLEALAKIEPTKEEASKLSNYEGDVRELRPAEKFMKEILSIPCSFQKIEVMLFRETFEDEVALIRNSFQILNEACEELRCSRLFMRLLETVLRTGNRMNAGTIRGGARAFKLDALLKLADVKGTDGKTTLLHFVVQEVIRLDSDGIIEMSPPNNRSDPKIAEEKGLELVTGLFTELCNVKKTASIDLDMLATSVSHLSNGMEKIKRLIQDDLSKDENENNVSFVKLMDSFRIQGEEVVKELIANEEQVMIRVREITEYFHGNVSKDEANPLRIFVIVRDFLGMLDRVCKELGSSKTQHCLNRVMPF